MRIPLFALILIATPAWGQSMEDLRVHPTARELEVSFRVEEAFSDTVEERVQSGLPTAFIFQFDLLRDRKHWWDDYLRSATLEVVAMYNAVSQEYLLNIKQNGKLVESRTARSLRELERLMTRFEGWPVFRLDDLPAGTRLLIKARARLGGKTYLDLVPVNVTTDWVSSRKFLVPDSEGG
ncbi:MAG: DUF4390 domain-containing protein [Thermoanaerobaculia bacterium]|nr:DUF4390 domain-containing protein [Thermoanaerobaculia bacterium]